LTAGIPSPCVGICIVDDARVCIGCRRSLDEIAAWSTATNEQKRRMLDAADRRALDTTEQTAAGRSRAQSCPDLPVNPVAPTTRPPLIDGDGDSGGA